MDQNVAIAPKSSTHTVLVTGGTGVLGRHVVSDLRDQGHEVRVLSRRAGAGTHQGDLATGEGLDSALAGVELVVHAASATPGGRTDLGQTRHLLDAAGRLGVRHLLYISIVGIDSIPYGYYARKLACEQAISASGVPHTILRAAQFHELLERGLQAVSRLPVAALPLDWKVQPIASAEVAERIVSLIQGSPAGRAPDIGGPQVLTFRQVVQAWRAHRTGPRAVINLPLPGRTARALRQGLNTVPAHAEGRQTWDQFLAAGPGSRPSWRRARPEPGSGPGRP